MVYWILTSEYILNAERDIFILDIQTSFHSQEFSDHSFIRIYLRFYG